MLNAIVLAGDTKGSPVEDISCKAFIKIRDRFMVEYVLDSLRASSYVSRIIVVGPENLLSKAIGDKVEMVIQSGDSIMKNVKKGIQYFNEDNHILVCTSDIPMVSSEAIDDFARQCMDRNVDVGYPIIEKSLNDVKYPDVKRTYVKMKEGTYTGGNIMYINPKAIDSCFNIAEILVENRKNAIKMGKALGIPILVELSLGILKIKTVEKRVNKLFGINARAIETSYPEIGNDVDKASDVDFVNKYMGVGA
jgi:Molybdopterin-guanine dinucleotide biosynthesis protein A